MLLFLNSKSCAFVNRQAHFAFIDILFLKAEDFAREFVDHEIAALNREREPFRAVILDAVLVVVDHHVIFQLDLRCVH